MHLWTVESENSILCISCINAGPFWFIVTKTYLVSEMVFSACWPQ